MVEPLVVSKHMNSESELATIEKVQSGNFAGSVLLVLHDDNYDVKAPMLLDPGTIHWLQEELAKLVVPPH